MEYKGTLNRYKLKGLTLRAYDIFIQQRKRAGVKYTARQFIPWWIKQYKSRKWKRPHVARFDHDKPYSFDNIEMQEQSENNRERNNRRGNPALKKSVIAIWDGCRKSIMEFSTMGEAADHFGVNRKTVFNHCTGRTKQYFKYGPGAKTMGVRFEWNTK